MTVSPAKIQVRFTDLDVLGHVNNNVYLSYFEMARVHYFKELLGENWNWRKHTVVLAKNEVEYIRPVLLEHQPEVIMQTESIGNKSFCLRYELRVNGIVFARGSSVLVSFDGETNQSVQIHERMREALEKLKN